MSRPSLATPCPAPNSALPLPVGGRRPSSISLGGAQDDTTTTELEYTRALQLDLKGAKPRRKSKFRPRERREAAVTIFEDVLEEEELVVQSRRELGGRTLLGRPAQRIPRRDMREKREDAVLQHAVMPDVASRQRRSAVAAFVQCDLEPPRDLENDKQRLEAQQVEAKSSLAKEPRRRTIFVPTDDTTILTIHPGANTTDRLNDTFQFGTQLSAAQPVYETTLSNPDAEVVKQPKRPRMSLAAAPKRLPLQHVVAKEANGTGVDVAGQNGGKENMLPDLQMDDIGKKPAPALHHRPPRRSLAVSKLFEPTAASQARTSVVARKAVPLPGTASAPDFSKLHSVQPSSNIHRRLSVRPSPPQSDHFAGSKSVSSRMSFAGDMTVPPKPNERRMELKTARLQQYPVLSEDIAQPELYEDVWLSHQEVALTELVNQVYTSTEPERNRLEDASASRRERLLHIYHQPEVATLHKRLQASLLYGALSRPRDLSKPPDPAQDIGLRKRFLGLWLDGYETGILRVAAEVVFGRQLPSGSNTKRTPSTGTIDPHRHRRALIGFLETFLVEVDDVEEPSEERGDDPNAPWRKTVLRSLMLIWLLEQAKQRGVATSCLFKASSARKSSVAMLDAIAGMLIGSVGDITRVLRHLDYEVRHVQDPLDEVKYRIENIAVDLRDGILLTKLVEVLLFSPNRLRTADMQGDATVTIRMPDLTILESALHDEDSIRILSQHLKMPCLGRVQKLYNVQIALSALRDHGRLGESAEAIAAEDIVDGHREKTLSLLWSLVSNFGLQQLVDFRELAADIRRNAGAAVDVQALLGDGSRLSQSQHEGLLKKWASVHAMRQGIRVGNLTTSFADGKVYATILDAFAEHIHLEADNLTNPKPTPAPRLERQLRAFGCSTAFIKQLSSNSGTIPSRKTTISNLAFLASRLLPLARQSSAAMVIQRAYRRRLARTAVSERVVLMRLAHACATVVRTQERLVDAAVVLQRAWRGVLDARIGRLHRNVESFQVLAKGWLVRRRQMKARVSRGVAAGQSLRIMGGW
ncbi:hypothetical protein BDY17DRAFT_325413 [Neohortaea acidophila]|uniref:Calponin-homology (CH) domain-containing protein n=1 Tax=Neohortaea acidophila TaxID=245834 RepID=A0A6A6PPQ9_9PEZI|nr:uncharacterized protein BDY17DRAFT_325413 [Neohortaea acidophila]KAF2481905.1 hypothetical protein BDY17DRAFT_325413 [Neohortaea acidophila]